MSTGLTELITLKLLLEDQEAIKNLKLTEAEVAKLKQSVAGIDDEFLKSFERIKGSLQGIAAPIQNQVLPGTVKLNMAMNQLGYVVNDASMFLVNFRMGMMGIANNIPFVIGLFQQAKLEIASTGGTMKSALINSIMGPGGLMLAINALMVGMQFLPDLLDSISQSTDELSRTMSDEEKQIRTKRNEYNMLIGVLQDVNAEESLRKEALKQLKEHYPEYITLQEKDLSNNEKIAAALKKGNEQFELKIRLAASEQVLKEYYDEVANAEYEIIKLEEKRKGIQKQFDEGNKSRGFSLVAIDNDIAELEKKKIEASKKVQEFNIEVLKLESLIDDKPTKDKKDKKDKPDKDSDPIKFSKSLIAKAELEPAVRMVGEEELQKARIQNIQDRFERERQLADFELEVARKKYEGVINGELMITEAIEQNKIRRNEIAQEEANAKLSIYSNMFGNLKGMFAEHTFAYKAFTIFQTIIDTYQAATAAYKSTAEIPIVGPFMAPIQAALATAFGLGQVANIEGKSVPGYAEGGLLPKGRSGFIEGWHNEIIAPEKTFVEVMRTQILPQLYAPAGNNLSGFERKMDSYISEIRDWQKEMTFYQLGDNLVATNNRKRIKITDMEY